MTMPDAQKSEVHATSADASTSPTARGDADATRPAVAPSPQSPKRDFDPLQGDLRVVSDDTDAGGPLVIESDDPGLQHIDLPKEEFPQTDRTPEIDPPIEK